MKKKKKKKKKEKKKKKKRKKEKKNSNRNSNKYLGMRKIQCRLAAESALSLPLMPIWKEEEKEEKGK